MKAISSIDPCASLPRRLAEARRDAEDVRLRLEAAERVSEQMELDFGAARAEVPLIGKIANIGNIVNIGNITKTLCIGCKSYPKKKLHRHHVMHLPRPDSSSTKEANE